jgi:hypothetical protein
MRAGVRVQMQMGVVTRMGDKHENDTDEHENDVDNNVDEHDMGMNGHR